MIIQQFANAIHGGGGDLYSRLGRIVLRRRDTNETLPGGDDVLGR